MWNIETERKRLAEEYEKTTTLIKTENEYVRIWEDVWSNENKESLKEKLRDLQSQLSAAEKAIATDSGCMAEIRHVLTEQTAVMDGRTRTWDKIRDRDVGAMDVDITTLETELEQLNMSYGQLQDHADELQKVIDEVEERKRVRVERTRLKREKMAIIIQAFWRAMMVRKFLGPFKVLKKIFKKKPKKKIRKK